MDKLTLTVVTDVWTTPFASKMTNEIPKLVVKILLLRLVTENYFVNVGHNIWFIALATFKTK